MKKLLRWLLDRYGGEVPTNNPGTGTKPEDETLKVLKSIDDRMAVIEKAVSRGYENKGSAIRTCGRYD